MDDVIETRRVNRNHETTSRIRYTTIYILISEANPGVRSSAWKESGHWLCKNA